MKSILDPSFQYTTSHNTDVRKTFARLRHQQPDTVGPAHAAPAVVNIAPMAKLTAIVRKIGAR